MFDDLPSWDVLASMLAYGVLLPAAVAAAVLLLGTILGKTTNLRASRIAGALAFALGFWAGYAALCLTMFGTPILQRDDPWQWLPFVATVAVLLDLVDIPFHGWKYHDLLRLLGAACAPFVIADSLVPKYESLESRPGWLAALVITTIFLWLAWAPLPRRSTGGGFPLILGLVPLAAGAVLEAAGSMRFAQIAGVLAGILGGCACVSCLRPGRQLTRGMMAGLAVVLPALMLNGYLSGEWGPVGPTSFALVVFAPLAAWIEEIPAVRKLRPVGRTLVLAASVLTPLAVAVALALTA